MPRYTRDESELELVIDGVVYLVDWEALVPGASFFIPTLATPPTIQKALRPHVVRTGYELAVASRCEHDIYGARIWRLL